MKILIVDDESLARQRLARLLTRLRPESQLLEADSGLEALAQVETHDPEILLLDIRMPQMDGVEVASRLLDHASPPAIIFCTAFDEYALAALQHQAVAYVLKPARERELERALQACVRVNKAQLDALGGVDAEGRDEIVSAGHRGIERMPLAEVRCFLAEDKYVRACGPEGDLLLVDALKDLEWQHAGRFVRVHRNALVAHAHITRLRRDAKGWFLEMQGVRVRPRVSRRHLASLKAVLVGR